MNWFKSLSTNNQFIISVDLNMTAEEMTEHEHPVFDMLQSFYKSNEPYTSLINKDREIDHLFCSTTLEKTQISEPYQLKFESLSSHSPLVYELKGVKREQLCHPKQMVCQRILYLPYYFSRLIDPIAVKPEFPVSISRKSS